MIAPPTYTVLSGYVSRDGVHWVYVKDHLGALIADEAYPEGTAVRIDGIRALRS